MPRKDNQTAKPHEQHLANAIKAADIKIGMLEEVKNLIFKAFPGLKKYFPTGQRGRRRKANVEGRLALKELIKQTPGRRLKEEDRQKPVGRPTKRGR